MAWIATDDFDSYTLTNDLNGKNGGSNWTSAWTQVAGVLTIETAPSGGQGGNAVRCNADPLSEYHRSMTAITQGFVSYRVRLDSASPSGDFKIVLDDSTNGKMFVNFASDGTIKIWNGNTVVYDTLQTYAANTWYTIVVHFDNTDHPGLYRVRINDSYWSAFKSVDGGSYASISRFHIDAETGFNAVAYVDDIRSVALGTSWVAADSFDSYATGAELVGLSDGANWVSPWAAFLTGWSTPTTGHKSVEVAPSGGQGGKAVRANTTTETHYYREIAPLSAGSVSWRMRISITNPNDNIGVTLRSSIGNTGGRMYIRFGPTGNIETYDDSGGVYETIQAYSADTWYQCEMQFDNTNQPNQYRARIDGGSWTPWNTVNTGSYASITTIDLDSSATNAHTMWFDDIRVTAASLSPFVSASNINFYKSRKQVGY